MFLAFSGGVLAVCSAVASDYMFAFIVFTIVREHEGQIPVQRYVALVHAQAMCLHCVCVVLEALIAWRS